MSIWSKFDKQSAECYLNMISTKASVEPWLQAFSYFKKIVEEEQMTKGRQTLEQLEEDSEWKYDFTGWLEDFLDALDIYEEYEKLLSVDEYLLEALDWPEGDDLDLSFYKAMCLRKTGKIAESIAFCKEWMAEEPDNYQARAALIYAYMEANELEKAETLAREILDVEKECDDDNYILYRAAENLYRKKGNTRRANQLKKEYERFDDAEEEKMMEELLNDDDDDDDDFYSFF